jgi:endonuclease/exonuclease/phosphatase family metal-dependent hydrolase
LTLFIPRWYTLPYLRAEVGPAKANSRKYFEGIFMKHLSLLNSNFLSASLLSAAVIASTNILGITACSTAQNRPNSKQAQVTNQSIDLIQNLSKIVNSGSFYAKGELDGNNTANIFKNITDKISKFSVESSYILHSEKTGTLVFKVREDTGKNLGSAILVASVDITPDKIASSIEKNLPLNLEGVIAPNFQTANLKISFQVKSASNVLASVTFQENGQDKNFSANLTAGVYLNTPVKQSYEILQYNAENLWDAVPENSKYYDEYNPEKSNWYQSDVLKAKGEQIAKAIALSGSPEIVALEEIESANNKSEALKIIQPLLEKQGYRYFKLGLQNENNPVSVTSAIVSKFPIAENERVDFDATDAETLEANDPEMRGSFRDPQVGIVNVAGNPVAVYVSHWKSKRSADEIGSQLRTKIASLMRADFDKRLEKNKTLDAVFVGDFNTDYTDNEVVKGLGTTQDESSLLNTTGLYSLWFELNANERCSYPHDGKLTCIDNMVVSHTLYDNSKNRYADNSFHVVGHNEKSLAQKFLLNANGLPLRWQVQRIGYNPREVKQYVHMKNGFSDHLPLVARFYAASEGENFPPFALENGHKVEQNPPVSRTEPSINCTKEAAYVRLTGQETATEYSQNLGRCVSLSAADNIGFLLNSSALYTITADTKNANKVPLAIEFNHNFGVNRQAYNDFVLNAPGRKSVVKVSGKLGIVNGFYGIIVENPASDIEFSGQEVNSCGSLNKAELATESLNAETFAQNQGKCASFTGGILKKFDLSVAKNSNFGNVTLSNGLVLELRLRENEATEIFAQGTEFEVSGVAVLDIYEGKKQLNLVAFGKNTGKILSVKKLK